MSAEQLVIGIGSPHGEDRAGWEVVERLEQEYFQGSQSTGHGHVALHTAAVPHDILDWLTPDATVHLIDANLEAKPTLRRFAIRSDRADRSTRTRSASGRITCQHSDPLLCATAADGMPQVALALAGPAFPGLRSGSSHQIDLISTLQLAATLELLPAELVLWAIGIAAAGRRGKSDDMYELDGSTVRRIEKCAQRIAQELGHA